jgi:glycosyltransferase involved in cell wall biosynthesis
MKPLVTILCISYNQEKYIKQTIEGFLMQKVNFTYEILIHDDASTDGTQKIIKKFAAKEPKIFRPLLETENQYSKNGVQFLKDMYQMAEGKYIAVCEGDDYWTDPDKLQTQVDFMESNPDYSVCFHQVRIEYSDNKTKDQIYPDVSNKSWYNTKELLMTNYIQTNSVLYRRHTYEGIATNVTPSDWYMHLYHASLGKIKFIEKVMSVYRKHPGGMWWDYDIDRDAIWQKHGVDHLTMWVELKKVYAHKSPVYIDIINKHIEEMVDTMLRIDETYNLNTMSRVSALAPEVVSRIIHDLNKELKDKNIDIENAKKAKDDLEQVNKQLKQELDEITSTRVWRSYITLTNKLGLHKKPTK